MSFGEYTIIIASISLLGIFGRIVTGQLYRIEVASSWFKYYIVPIN